MTWADGHDVGRHRQNRAATCEPDGHRARTTSRTRGSGPALPFRTCAPKPDAVTPVPSPPEPAAVSPSRGRPPFLRPTPQKSFAHVVASSSSSLPTLLLPLHSFEPAMAASKPLPLRLAVPLALALVANFLWACSSRRASPLSASSSRKVPRRRAPHCPGTNQHVLSNFRRSIYSNHCSSRR